MTQNAKEPLLFYAFFDTNTKQPIFVLQARNRTEAVRRAILAAESLGIKCPEDGPTWTAQEGVGGPFTSPLLMDGFFKVRDQVTQQTH